MDMNETLVTINKQSIMAPSELAKVIDKYLDENTPNYEREYLFAIIWEQNKRYAISVLKQKFGAFFHDNAEEMLQEVSMEIFINLPKYDKEKGAFITFIKPIIIHAGQSYINSEIYRTTAHYGAHITKIKKCLAAFEKEGIDLIEVSPNMIAQKTNIPIHTVLECLDQINFSEAGKTNTIENITDIVKDEHLSPEEEYIKKEEQKVIQKALDKLPEQSKRILLMKYGFENGEVMPDSKIAEELGINKAIVRRVLNTSQRTLLTVFKREQIFTSRNIRRDIDALNKEIAFVPTITKNEVAEAEIFLHINEDFF